MYNIYNNFLQNVEEQSVFPIAQENVLASSPRRTVEANSGDRNREQRFQLQGSLLRLNLMPPPSSPLLGRTSLEPSSLL